MSENSVIALGYDVSSPVIVTHQPDDAGKQAQGIDTSQYFREDDAQV